MQVSSIGYLNRKELRNNTEDYRAKTRYYDNAALFGQIKEDNGNVKKDSRNGIFGCIKNLFASKEDCTKKQALNLIG